jgi:hypothetical protein
LKFEPVDVRWLVGFDGDAGRHFFEHIVGMRCLSEWSQLH